jgi:hypothetical protein
MTVFKPSLLSSRAPSGAMTIGRRSDRTNDELIGLCRGILCDGSVSRMEAEFLLKWINRNADFADQFPFNYLLEHLHHALEHGVLDADDESDLLHTLTRFVGGEANGECGSESASLSTALPLDDPEPDAIEFAANFVVTGTFTYGPRSQVVSTIQERGGVVMTSVSKKTRYLIIGEIGSRDWMHSTYGRKIEHACELRSGGIQLSIICEKNWARCIESGVI